MVFCFGVVYLLENGTVFIVSDVMFQGIGAVIGHLVWMKVLYLKMHLDYVGWNQNEYLYLKFWCNN